MISELRIKFYNPTEINGRKYNDIKLYIVNVMVEVIFLIFNVSD